MAEKNYGNNSQLAELVGYISDTMKFPIMGAGGGFAPIGTESYFDGTSAPQGWLLCNGQTLNITDYPELATYFASHHGSSNYYGGNGTTTFAVPTRSGMPNNEDNVYEESEHIVGVWTDGKPIYEKTFTFSHTTVGEYDFADKSTYNMDIIMVVGCYAKQASGDIYEFPDLYFRSNDDRQRVFIKPNGAICHDTGSFAVQGTVYVTLQYTKTTDTPIDKGHSADGNGVFCIKATVAGDPNAHQYSTEEQVVGTWIDGKPLYEKTWTGSLSSTSSNVNVEINNPSFVKIESAGVVLSTGEYIPHGARTAGNSFLSFFVGANKDTVGIRSSSDYAKGTYYFVLQYTKTTD